ncbi:MAG: zf-HC2 domain-containing protein [Gammaproteobacteria bacterium]|nr:zf-HC2 domain-containing protein [Gammaproteobacteria bacterium]
MNERYPDLLQAYVDGQLDPTDRARVLEQLEHDPALREAACELHRIKEAVRCAFENPPAAPRTPVRRQWPWRRNAAMVAAALLLPLGFLLGRWSAPPALEDFTLATQPAMRLVTAPQTSQRVVLHVGEGHADKFLVALDSAEELMRFLPNGRVDVIVNAGGLDLVRADRSPYSERVAELMVRYPNVHFVACNITMDKQRALGDEPVLLRGTDVAPSAAEHIIERMEQGWIYLRV